MWITLSGRLLTNEEQRRREMKNDDSCGICACTQEPTIHSLWDFDVLLNQNGKERYQLMGDCHNRFFATNTNQWILENIENKADRKFEEH